MGGIRPTFSWLVSTGGSSAHIVQDLFPRYNMDVVYLDRSVFRDLWHEYDMKEVLVSKSIDGWDTLCEEIQPSKQ